MTTRIGPSRRQMEAELKRLRTYRADHERILRGENITDATPLMQSDVEYLLLLASKGKIVVNPSWLRGYAVRIAATLKTSIGGEQEKQ